MFKKRDLVLTAVAAVGAFGLTLGIFLPRMANATAQDAVGKVLSPVLRVSGVEIQAFAVSSQEAMKMVSTNAVVPASRVYLSAEDGGMIPQITFVLRNTSDQESRVAFSASLDSSRPMGRRLSSPTTQWNDSYDLVLMPGETREITADPRISFGTGVSASLILRAAGPQPAAISALSFSVVTDRNMLQQTARATPAAAQPPQPVKFVTQPAAGSAKAQPGVSPVQAAVLAGLKASREKSEITQPAPVAETPAPRAPRPEINLPTDTVTPIQAAVIAGLKASQEKPAAGAAANAVARGDDVRP